MPRLLALAGVLITGLATSVLLSPGAAQAAVTCAPDAYEIDDDGEHVAPIAVGETVYRAICQGREPLPGKPYAQDVDFFEFTAVEGQAYTVEAVGVGAALQPNGAGAGGLGVGFSTVTTPVDQLFGGARTTTGPLRAGVYRIGAETSDQQIYPEDNVLTTKTVEGDEQRTIAGNRNTKRSPVGRLSKAISASICCAST